MTAELGIYAIFLLKMIAGGVYLKNLMGATLARWVPLWHLWAILLRATAQC